MTVFTNVSELIFDSKEIFQTFLGGITLYVKLSVCLILFTNRNDKLTAGF